jgi:AcrR family transcriptional regulator
MARISSREAVLGAALAEFDEKGYDATTVAGICRRAAVSNGSFFHAYPSKEAVAGAVFLSALRGYHDALIGAVTPRLSATRGVSALVSTHVSWVIRNRQQARFMFLHGMSRAQADVHAEQHASNARFRDGLSAWYAPHFHSGRLHDMSPELLVSQIIGPAQMFCRAWLAGRTADKPDRHLSRLTQCAIRAVVTQA